MPPTERAKWRRDPDWFATQWLGITLRPDQEAILNVLRYKDWVAIPAPNGSGKAYAGALAVAWWLMAHDEVVAITTAPTERRV